jgi:hypothetical protein
MFVVIPPALCEAPIPFRSMPLSSKGRGGWHGERTLDELVEFPTV